MVYNIKRKITEKDIESYSYPKFLGGEVYNPLLEKLLDLDQDVNYIYEVGFKNLVNKIEKGLLVKVPSPIEISSNELTLNLCKKAHILKPMLIQCGVFNGGSQYHYTENRMTISLQPKVMSVLGVNGFDLKKASEDLSISIEAIKNEYSEAVIKSSIVHELSHWIRDILYRNTLTEFFITIQNDAIKRDYKSLTHFEVDAQIHAIRQIKLFYIDEWDTMKLSDVFRKYTALYAIVIQMLQKNAQIKLMKWFKALIKRMVREDLLGFSMRMEDLDEFFVKWY